MPTDLSYHRRDVQHFERWSQGYEDSWMQARFFTRIHHAVLGLAAPLAPPTIVLDIGCGTGRLLRAAATRWPEAKLVGIDPAQGMVAVARRLTPDATILRGLAEVLPLSDGSVDLVLSTLSCHHWQDQAAGFREIVRVLRPGGHVILADVALPSSLAWFPIQRGGLPAPLRQRLFSAAGLHIERQQRVVYPLILATVAAR
jgi:SAM-dependent methyltransferase